MKGGELVGIRSALVRLYSLIRRDEDGQGLAEYALILALIAIVAISALMFLGSQVSDKLSVIGSSIDSVTP
jgi:pilus assembly protein Flp/PilA